MDDGMHPGSVSADESVNAIPPCNCTVARARWQLRPDAQDAHQPRPAKQRLNARWLTERHAAALSASDIEGEHVSLAAVPPCVSAHTITARTRREGAHWCGAGTTRAGPPESP
eukprot:2542579-Rhodomonas_salina.2